MEFKEVAEKRRSVRSFEQKEIPKEDIEEIIEIGHTAPSAGNRQARDFILISDQKEKEKLVENAYGQSFIAEAPWVIIACAHQKRSAERYGERGRDLYSIQDASAAVENILLAVVDKGYASVWIGAFEEEKVKVQLDIPEGVRPVAILPIGYPDETPTAPKKMDADELTHHGEW
ncbi:MAG: nitroreductase family protein [Candidatus Thermoplasmatota archaeon]|nr:nitroreductase family protein [Candidatus Thermoplasmatota archaeon]